MKLLTPWTLETAYKAPAKTAAAGAKQMPQRLPHQRPVPALEHAAPLTKLGRLRRELWIWAKAGLPLAPRSERQRRLNICQPCDYYSPAGNLGLGECRAPGCGCTRAKLALATSQCPLMPPKWGPYYAPRKPLSAPLQPPGKPPA